MQSRKIIMLLPLLKCIKNIKEDVRVFKNTNIHTHLHATASVRCCICSPLENCAITWPPIAQFSVFPEQRAVTVRPFFTLKHFSGILALKIVPVKRLKNTSQAFTGAVRLQDRKKKFCKQRFWGGEGAVYTLLLQCPCHWNQWAAPMLCRCF